MSNLQRLLTLAHDYLRTGNIGSLRAYYESLCLCQTEYALSDAREGVRLLQRRRSIVHKKKVRRFAV